MTSAVVSAASKSSSGGLSLLFPLLLVVMIGFLFLSTRKRKQSAQQMQSALKVGSQVMTTAGLYAKVMRVEDDGVTLEVAPGVNCKYARQAISKVLDAPEGAEPLDNIPGQSSRAAGRDEDPPTIDLDKDPPTKS